MSPILVDNEFIIILNLNLDNITVCMAFGK